MDALSQENTSAGTRQVFDRMRCGQDYQVSYEVNGTPKTVKLWKSSELKATPARYGAVDTAPNTAVWNINRNEFVERLNAQQCEYWGVTDTACEVHHVRKMADMKAAPFGRHIIAARTRKRIVLCKACHVDLHAGRLHDRRYTQPDVGGEPDALKGASPVRRGAEGCSHWDITRPTLRIPDFVPPTIEETPWRAPEAAEIILANSGAVVRISGEKAFYSPTTDHIQMPPQGAFATSEGFCGTLVHELGHWTGQSRG